MLKKAIFLVCISVIANIAVFSQVEFDSKKGTPQWMMFSDAPNALYHHLARQAYEFLNKRSHEVAGIKNLSDWKKRQQWIKKTLSEIVGAFPEKTELQATVTKIIHKEGYRIENIVYQSRPGYYVSSSLFIPGELKDRKAPAIVYCSGHSNDGYRSYLHVIINLVKKGFIVFAFDPIGQGERVQYLETGTNRSRFRFPAYEHSYAGAQVFMAGGNLASYFIWDGIRAVDYLQSRTEVDAGRIGITGRSGGGTQSTLIAAFDNRIIALASENYFTNFTRLYQSIGPQDAEQNLPGAIARGIDMADLLLVRAPKPALMITTSLDMFPIAGAIETATEVSRIYKAYGQENQFYRVSDDERHASTKKNRESMYAFFQKYLQNPGDSTDMPVTVTKDELQVTPTGQVNTSFNSETVFSLNTKDVQIRQEKLEKLRKNWPGYFPQVLQAAKELSGYRTPGKLPEASFIGRVQRKGYTIEKYFIEGEGGYAIPYLVMKPVAPVTKALLYLNPAGKAGDAEEGGPMEWFVRRGFIVLAPDLVGMGEMGPGVFRGDSYIDSVSYNIWFASVLINRSIVGIQAGDVVRLAKFFQKENNLKEIYGLAKGQFTPLLLHAAAFDTVIKKIALWNPVLSYWQIVMNRKYDARVLHSLVAGSIGVYDLPDLAASLAPRKLLLAGVENDAASASQIFAIEAPYRKSSSKDNLQFVPEDRLDKLTEVFERWMN